MSSGESWGEVKEMRRRWKQQPACGGIRKTIVGVAG